MHKILVTGATGQLGSTVIKTLLKKKAPQQINVISRQEEKVAELKSQGLNNFVGSYE